MTDGDRNTKEWEKKHVELLACFIRTKWSFSCKFYFRQHGISQNQKHKIRVFCFNLVIWLMAVLFGQSVYKMPSGICIAFCALIDPLIENNAMMPPSRYVVIFCRHHHLMAENILACGCHTIPAISKFLYKNKTWKKVASYVVHRNQSSIITLHHSSNVKRWLDNSSWGEKRPRRFQSFHITMQFYSTKKNNKIYLFIHSRISFVRFVDNKLFRWMRKSFVMFHIKEK